MRGKFTLTSIVVAGVVLALAGGSVAWAKAHVPLGRVQICTASGDVRNVSPRALANRLNADACRLTACVFNEVEGTTLLKKYIFVPGEDCDPVDLNKDGFCDDTGAPGDIPKRLKAVNVTTACTDSF